MHVNDGKVRENNNVRMTYRSTSSARGYLIIMVFQVSLCWYFVGLLYICIYLHLISIELYTLYVVYALKKLKIECTEGEDE